MPDAAYGLGYPFFNYYAALPYYLAAGLVLWGWGPIAALKVTQTIGFLVSGAAMYRLGREVFHRRTSALLSSVAYVYAPFHLVNVYVRGDSLSEFYALVWYPLLGWAILRLRKRASTGNVLLLGGAYGGLVLTHNISALIATPVAVAYALPLLFAYGGAKTSRVRFLLAGLAGGLLGLALSSWFWLPALLERDLVQLQEMTTGYFHFAGHFRGADLVQRRWLFDYAIGEDRTPFCMGLVQALLAGLGSLALIGGWIRRRRIAPQGAFALTLLLFTTLCITPLSRSLWEHVPLLPLAQFPWRFLSMQALFASLLIGVLAETLPHPGVVTAVAVLLLIGSALGNLRPEWMAIGERDITSDRLRLYEYFTANIGTTIRHEYLPRWVVPRPYTSEVLLRSAEKPPLVLDGEVKAAELVWHKPAAEGWALDVTSPQASLAFHTYYFPGWRAYVDGQPTEVWPVENLGYIGLDLDQGEHQVVLRLERTPLRVLAEGLSLAAALAVVGLLIVKGQEARGKKQGVDHRLWAVAMAVLLVGVLLRLMPTPESDISDLTMDFDRLPYLHHNPQGVNFGGTAWLKSYRLSVDEVEAGETVEVVLHWDEVRGEGLEADVSLLSPAEHLFHTSACLAEDSVPLRAGTTHHCLKVPGEAVRGIYLISVKLRDEEGEIRPITERGETLGTTYLRPLRIRSERWATGDEPTLASFGSGIVLSEVETEQKRPEALEARLTWRVVEPVAANYGLALRLRDGDGQALDSLDLQPHYGLYPTSMWRGGELISDRYVLSLPEGTPPGEDYSLEVILYEVASLAPIGTAQVFNVALTKPTIKALVLDPLSLGQRTKGDKYRATYPVLQEFGQLALVELSPMRAQIEQGQPLLVQAKWAATEHPTRDYACRLSLKDEGGATVHSQTQPIARSYATSLWPTNAIVASRYQTTLDPLLPPGHYDLAIVVLDPQTGEGFGEFVAPLAIVIERRERSYAIPPMQAKLDVSFGGQMRLLGYHLRREEGELRLGLHWQALRQMERDYKVFVHLFDPATEEIVAQDDAMPRQNQYPTSWWAEGEVVSDEITISLEGLPLGRYRLALGVYDPQTMDRLAAVGPDDTPVANNRVVLDEEVEMP